MKRKYIISIILIILLIIVGTIFLMKEKNYPDDENTLYTIKFDNIELRVERYDYVLGQNQIVGVEKSMDNGKTFKKITKDPITVSMEPQFVFLNQNLGFVITKPNITKSSNYIGVKVTQDGGKTFTNANIIYDNPKIEIITIEGLPYYDHNVLKLHCSIYQMKEDNTGYEDIDLIFISSDDGLTWNLE